MKKPLIIIIIIVLALIATVAFKIPALEWVAKIFDILKIIFSTLANWCRALQRLVDWGFIK